MLEQEIIERGRDYVNTDFCNTDDICFWKAFAVFHQSGLGDRQDIFYYRASADRFDRHSFVGSDVCGADPAGSHRGGVAAGKSVGRENDLPV